MIIGFNTGSLYKNVNPISKEAIDLVRTSGSNIIELSAGFYERIERLIQLTKQDLKGFSYITIHAPTDVIYKNDDGTNDLLEKLRNACRRLSCSRIVFHPQEIEDFDLLSNFPCEIAFENLDNPQSSYRTVEDMKKIFNNNDHKMVLDLTHAYIVDRRLQLARDFHNEFADRIVQYHLSGYRIHSDDGQQHYPISETLQTEILQMVKLDKPLMIESVFPKYKDPARLKEAMSKELDYVCNFFKK